MANNMIMPFSPKITFLWLILSVVNADRLENVRQVPLTGSHTSGPASNLQLPYQNEYTTNLYKGLSVNTYTAAPLLHKPQYTASSHTSIEDRRDIIPIVKQAFEPNSGDGSYAYSYETANGISVSEYGAYKAGPTSEERILSASGSYSYTGPDNVVYTITYTAGPQGFVAQGDHLPTPPPIPEAIHKILQYTGEGVKLQQYNESKYQGYDSGSGTTSNRYTAAVQSPYSSYIPSNPNHSKLASYTKSNYNVQDDYSRK